MTCTGSHTVTQADIDAGGNLTNIATADSDQTDPGVTDTLSIPIQPPAEGPHHAHRRDVQRLRLEQPERRARRTPTYSVKSGKVNNVAPGVMFYYITITAPSASFTINVTQSNDKGLEADPGSGDQPDHPVRVELLEEQQGSASYQHDDRDGDDHGDRSDGRCDLHRRSQVQPERPRRAAC